MKRGSDLFCAVFCLGTLMTSLSASAKLPYQEGTYATEGSWGQLIIGPANPAGSQSFSLDTESAGSGCTLSGRISAGGPGAIAYEDNTPTQCWRDLTASPEGVSVSTSTKQQCREYRGSNGSFEADYQYVTAECTQPALHKTRSAFKTLYGEKNMPTPGKR